MELEEQLEIDIENKYIKNKENTEFTIEEVLYILKRKYFCDEVEDMAINRIIKYIKEESISKTVVEEKIKQLKEQSGGNVFHIQQTINSNIRLLQEILNKGE